jgi:hypothetical protein
LLDSPALLLVAKWQKFTTKKSGRLLAFFPSDMAIYIFKFQKFLLLDSSAISFVTKWQKFTTKKTLLSMVQFAGCPQGITSNINLEVTFPYHCTNCEASLW